MILERAVPRPESAELVEVDIEWGINCCLNDKLNVGHFWSNSAIAVIGE